MGDELESVVHPDVDRYSVFGNDPVKDVDDPLGIDGPVDKSLLSTPFSTHR